MHVKPISTYLMGRDFIEERHGGATSTLLQILLLATPPDAGGRFSIL